MTPFWITVLAIGSFMAGLIIGMFIMSLAAMASKSEREAAKDSEQKKVVGSGSNLRET